MIKNGKLHNLNVLVLPMCTTNEYVIILSLISAKQHLRKRLTDDRMLSIGLALPFSARGKISLDGYSR